MIQCHCLWPFATSHLMRYPINSAWPSSRSGNGHDGKDGEREWPGALLARRTRTKKLCLSDAGNKGQPGYFLLCGEVDGL